MSARAPLVFACLAFGSHSSASELPESVSVIGSTVGTFDVAEGYVAYTVPEVYQSEDLNGDGDQEDVVLHTLDLRTGEDRNWGLATAGSTGVVGGWIATAVEEDSVGDLNGDGDADDVVAHVIHVPTAEVLGLGVAAGSFLIAEAKAFFTVYESMQGNRSLNADDDAADTVLHFFDLETRELVNLGLGTNPFPGSGYQVGGGRVAVVAREDQQGRDLNGDTDALDMVVGSFDLETLEFESTGWSTFNNQMALLGDLVLASPLEESQGNTDLNGDGSLDDVVSQLIDLETGTSSSLGGEVIQVLRRRDAAAYLLDEDGSGEDLNGDGDTFDRVLQLWQKGGPVRNTGLAGYGPSWNDRWLVFGVHEQQQGAIDLNGDGLLLGLVVHALDLRTGEITNLGGSTTIYELDGDYLLAGVPEAANGDLNGDGDTVDHVARLFHLPSGMSRNLGLAVDVVGSSVRLEDGLGVVLVREPLQGQTDLDGDGDATGSVHFVFEVDSPDEPENLGLYGSSSSKWYIDEHRAIFRLPESAAGDVNGDGDTSDYVLGQYDRRASDR